MIKVNWRFWTLGLFVVLGFMLMVVRLANLQVRGGDDYGAIAESTMTKTITERGARGQILDVNGALLAYSRKIYNIQFYRDPTSNQDKNGEYSKAIWEVIQLLKREGKDVKFDFWMNLDDNGKWIFDTKTEDPGVAEKREKMFRSNFYVFSDDVGEIYERLCSNYQIHQIDKEFSEDQKLTVQDKMRVLSVWQEMQMNAFNSMPITLAEDVSWSTVIEIETRLVALPGMSISVQNQRVYPKGTLACHVLGYTGKMQSEAQVQEYLAKGYQRDDTIGLDGVERSLEQYLTGNSATRRGKSVVEIDRSGRKIRQLSQTDPTDGNTVKLTIDASLQQVTETELDKIVNSIRDYEENEIKKASWLSTNKEVLTEYQARGQTPKMAQNGAIVVLDMNCRVKAMASFPNYDPNLFIIGMDDEQRIRMLKDERNPLFNNAIRAADTPGSVFKMCTALAALVNGKLTLAETISDGGPFTKYDTVNPPRCWIQPHYEYKHADQTIVQGLSHSCNFFFYTIAAELGNNGDGTLLYEYATKLGLTSKTNIDLPNEATSVVGSQISLYDSTKPINGYDQATWYPVQVKAKLKEHLRNVGETWQYSYSESRLDKCIKGLMDMACVTDQGEKQQTWVREIRGILMNELGMTRDMAYRQSVVGDIVLLLNEIKWGGTNTIMTGIGQGITMTTPIAMARYIAALANGGYVYDVQIIDSIIAPNGETVNEFTEPVLVNDLSKEIQDFLPAIKEGMKDVINDGGTANEFFDDWKYIEQIAGKTGTAEKSELDIESNSWFVCFAPYEKPEIVVVVYVPYGFSGKRSSVAARNIVEYYLDSKVENAALILPAPNALVQ